MKFKINHKVARFNTDQKALKVMTILQTTYKFKIYAFKLRLSYNTVKT